MPLWAWIAIGAAAVAIIALAVVGAIVASRTAERRYLRQLISKREAVTAVGQSLEGVVLRLSEADDETLELFADDPDFLERHVLVETCRRAKLVYEELDTQPLPRRLVPVAEALADAAFVVTEQAGKVEPEMRGESALDAVASIDLGRVRSVFASARRELQSACDACKLSDESVYGGGLYL